MTPDHDDFQSAAELIQTRLERTIKGTIPGLRIAVGDTSPITDEERWGVVADTLTELCNSMISLAVAIDYLNRT